MLFSMANEIFRLYQDKDKEGNGCTLSLLVMIAYLILGFFFVTQLGAGGALMLMVIAMFSWHYIRQRSRSACIVTTQDDGFTVEILKASAELEVGKSFLCWKDLLEFKVYSARGGTYLEGNNDFYRLRMSSFCSLFGKKLSREKDNIILNI
jgi:hypothetical protein